MQLDLSRHINAHPDRVWEILTDVPIAAATLSGVSRIEILTPGPYLPGYRWRETRRIFGLTSTEEMLVVAVTPQVSTRIVAASGGTEYTTVFTVAGTDEGSTLRMQYVAETSHAPAFARVVTSLLGGFAVRSRRKLLEQDLADIAAAAERSS